MRPSREVSSMRKLVLVVVSVLATAGCVPKSKFDAKSARADELEKALSDESARSAACDAKNAELQKDLEARKAVVDQLATELGVPPEEVVAAVSDLKREREETQLELQATSAQLESAEKEKEQLQKKSSEYSQLTKSLEQQIKAGQIQVSELLGKMTIVLGDQILFPSGSAKLSKKGMGALDKVATAFKSLKGRTILVAGFTDDVPVAKKGPFEDNWDLSSARAASVVRYLQSKGVDPASLGAAGYSQYRPVAKNDSEKGRARNRRIVIALTAADQPIVKRR
jgi:chemotaxis protein MotB